MSNWSVRNDHEVSVVTLMMRAHYPPDRAATAVAAGALAISAELIVKKSMIFITPAVTAKRS